MQMDLLQIQLADGIEIFSLTPPSRSWHSIEGELRREFGTDCTLISRHPFGEVAPMEVGKIGAILQLIPSSSYNELLTILYDKNPTYSYQYASEPIEEVSLSDEVFKQGSSELERGF